MVLKSPRSTVLFFRRCGILLTFLFSTLISDARNYYISSSSGNDSYSSTQAQSEATPWRSISKLNSFALSTGDVVYFKKGDTFYGTIIPNTGGISYSSYGNGNRPVITGLTAINSWTNLGNNIWEASVPGGLSTLNMVVINGVLTPMGRYPNAKTTNDGYLTYESSVVNRSLTDNQLSSSPNWNGGEVVFRRTNYTADRAKITNHSGSTISFSTYNGTAMVNGYGYFVQHHPATLDVTGEWYYDANNKKIRMYSTGTPNNVSVATLPSLIKMDFTNKGTKSNFNFTGLDFRGSEELMMQLIYCDRVTVDNCNFSYAGINAIEYKYVTNLTVKNSTITDVNMIGIQEYDSKTNNYVTIQNNTIRRIGIYPGMVSNAYGEAVASTGLNMLSQNLLVQENVLDSLGYIAIALKKNRHNQIIRRNVISNFCMIKNDGGAIYSGGLRGDPKADNIIIENNIISKAVGATGGTIYPLNKHTRAIYLDATSTGVQVLNNTIFDAWDGIYISQAQNMIIRGNTIYNTGNYKPGVSSYFSGAMVVADGFDGYQHTRYNTITNNIFFAKYPDQLLYYQTDRYDGVDQIGTVDSNYYANPGSDIPLIMTNTTTTSIQTIFSLPEWRQSNPNYDKNSKLSPRKIPQYIISNLGSDKAVNGGFNSNISGLNGQSTPAVHSLSWDNSSKVTGSGSAKLTSSVTSSKLTSIYQLVGPVTAGKKYILRFKTRATKAGAFQARIMQYTGCYCINSTSERGSFDTDLKQHEILLEWTEASQSSAALFIEFTQNASTVYIDDIQFQEATITPTNVDDYHRFLYNPNKSPLTVSLAHTYISVEGTTYNNGSITLAPFTSKILLRDTGAVVVPSDPAPPTERPKAAASAGPLNCSGSSTSVAVTATGGTAPYTGTGNFTTNSGKGSLKLSSNSSSSGSTILFASVGAVSKGKNYVLKFSTLSTTNGVITALLRQTAPPSKSIAASRTDNIGTTKEEHEFVFIPASDETNASFHIEIPQNVGITYFDNLAFFEATSTGELISSNLVGNGQFETGIDNISTWSSNNNAVVEWDNTGKINNINYYTVTDSKGGKSTIGIEVVQPAVPLAATVTLGSGNMLTVSASGGSYPYTGTGVFTARPGNNSFVVNDKNGCSVTTNIDVTADQGSRPSVSAVAPPVNCEGTSTNVTISATGGAGSYSGTGTFNTNAGRGSLRISFPTHNGTIKTVAFGSVGSVTAGKTYSLRFNTLGTTNNGQLSVVLRGFSAPAKQITDFETAFYGTTKIAHEFAFTPTASNNNASFHLEIFQSSGTTYIDNIAFFETDSDGDLISNNLFPDGQFENNINSIHIWSNNNNQAAAWDNTGKINNINYYTVTDAAGNKSTTAIEIKQPAVQLGASVNLLGQNLLTVNAWGGSGPYTGTGSFAAKLGLNNFLVRDANGCSSTASINILSLLSNRPAGESVGAEAISSTTLASGSLDEDQSLRISSYPNPAVSDIALVVSGGTSEKIAISVIGADGRTFYQNSGSSNNTYRFGSQFKPGLYIIKVLQGKNLKTLKVIKGK